MNEEEQKLAIQGITSLWAVSLLKEAKEEPLKLIKHYQEQITESMKLNIENTELKEKINKIEKYIDNLKPLSEEETAIKEMLKLAYKEDNIKNIETSFKAICHLEDFEIAIWNIKDILESNNNE